MAWQDGLAARKLHSIRKPTGVGVRRLKSRKLDLVTIVKRSSHAPQRNTTQGKDVNPRRPPSRHALRLRSAGVSRAASGAAAAGAALPHARAGLLAESDSAK